MLSWAEGSKVPVAELGCEDKEDQESAEDDEDDGVLFEQDGAGTNGGSIAIPCSVTTNFFHAEFRCESYPPNPTFGVAVSVFGPGNVRVEPQVWFEFSGSDLVKTNSFVESLRALEGLALNKTDFFENTSLAPQLRVIPPVAVICQLFAMAQAWRLRVQLDDQFVGAQDIVCRYFDMMCDKLALTADDFAPLFKVTEVLPRVFHLETKSRLVLASTFLRFQEHYEGQSTQFRRQSFTFDQLRDWYCSQQSSGREPSTGDVFGLRGWNYYLRWPGFNLPSWVLLWCRDNMAGGMRAQEQALLNVVLPLACAGDATIADAFYVIGSCLEDEDDGEGTLHHEMAHGLYFTNAAYKAAVQEELKKLPADVSAQMAQRLYALGYCDDPEIVEDEKQAYLVAGELLDAEDKQQEAVCSVQAAIRQVWRLTVSAQGNFAAATHAGTEGAERQATSDK